MNDYPTRYCEKCGERMVHGAWRGDQIEIMTPPDGCWRTYASAFSWVNGSQKLYQVYKCPDRKEWFFGWFNNGHDLCLRSKYGWEFGIRLKVK